MSSSTPDIRTRLLIISDTHGRRPFDAAIHPEEAQRYGFSRPLPKADVAIHCGDLTTRSDVKEYQVTFDVMREIDAPLKLVIPGNHDCSMDVDFWEKTVSYYAVVQPVIMNKY
ncbi:Metallophosphoesterase domain-containing protein 1 [Cytospora mali]|uniref:Metallophosphoesterase domain-containing protein 1 n=1 Tax=Cytospora mali TaxID=578113 RepID=A0A194UWU6_CYTMA|nr:Metallophosphoesterase domain-containing protein 1 [Valsa mali var. pyri (nom. inval.)]